MCGVSRPGKKYLMHDNTINNIAQLNLRYPLDRRQHSAKFLFSLGSPQAKGNPEGAAPDLLDGAEAKSKAQWSNKEHINNAYRCQTILVSSNRCTKCAFFCR
jgi:hypothetical protein